MGRRDLDSNVRGDVVGESRSEAGGERSRGFVNDVSEELGDSRGEKG